MEIDFVGKWYVVYSHCALLRTSKLFSLACLPSMCTIVIMSTGVWIGVQRWLKHHDISSSAAVFLGGRCGLRFIATHDFSYSVYCGHLKTKLNSILEIAWYFYILLVWKYCMNRAVVTSGNSFCFCRTSTCWQQQPIVCHLTNCSAESQTTLYRLVICVIFHKQLHSLV